MKDLLSCEIESAYTSIEEDPVKLDSPLFNVMWELFSHIIDFWELDVHLISAKSQLLVFMQNRIKMDRNYYSDYQITVNVLRELIEKFGKKKALQNF